MASLTDFINDATRDDMQRLEEALLRGEQLRWAVRPVPTAWTAATIPLIAFCPLWLGFIAFWTYAALGFPTSLAEVQALEGERMLFACFSLPFWLIGFWLLSSPWQQKRRMRHSLYLVTDRRALVIEKKLFSWNTKTYPLTEDLVRARKLRKEGRGDIIFGEDVSYGRNGRSHSVPVGFMNVPDVRLAEEKLDEAIRARCEQG